MKTFPRACTVALVALIVAPLISACEMTPETVDAINRANADMEMRRQQQMAQAQAQAQVQQAAFNPQGTWCIEGNANARRYIVPTGAGITINTEKGGSFPYNQVGQYVFQERGSSGHTYEFISDGEAIWRPGGGGSPILLYRC